MCELCGREAPEDFDEDAQADFSNWGGKIFHRGILAASDFLNLEEEMQVRVVEKIYNDATKNNKLTVTLRSKQHVVALVKVYFYH